MQQTRKTSFLKTLFGSKRRSSIEPKKAVQPLDERQLAQVVGGTRSRLAQGRLAITPANGSLDAPALPPSGRLVGGPVYPGRSAFVGPV